VEGKFENLLGIIPRGERDDKHRLNSYIANPILYKKITHGGNLIRDFRIKIVTENGDDVTFLNGRQIRLTLHVISEEK